MPSKIIIPTRFLKFFAKNMAWLRRNVSSKSYELFMGMCYAMNLRNQYFPALSLQKTCQNLYDAKSERMERNTVNELIKSNVVRLSNTKGKPECWEINPLFCVKTKFLAGSILEGWINRIPYGQEFEAFWKRIETDRQRNQKFFPLEIETTHEDEMSAILGKLDVLQEEMRDMKMKFSTIINEMLFELKKHNPEMAQEVEAKTERHLRLVEE